MNKYRRGKTITPALVQKIILALLLIIAPYAMTFTPYERIQTDGVWDTSLELDPLYPVRAGLIIVGLVAAIFSVCTLILELIRGVARKELIVSDLALHISMTTCSLYIGWAAFPYWVNGVFQASLDNTPVYLLDPRALMPSIWIGDSWTLGLYLTSFIVFFSAIVVSFLNLIIPNKKAAWKKMAASFICLAITAGLIFLSPNYSKWGGLLFIRLQVINMILTGADD